MCRSLMPLTRHLTRSTSREKGYSVVEIDGTGNVANTYITPRLTRTVLHAEWHAAHAHFACLSWGVCGMGHVFNDDVMGADRATDRVSMSVITLDALSVITLFVEG